MSDLPRVTPEPVLPGEAGPRLTAAIGRVLVRELPLARRAAHRLRARPTIALAVVVLASIGYFSNVFTGRILMRRLHPEYRPDQFFARTSERYSDESFAHRWLQRYEDDPSGALIFTPLRAFGTPLASADAFADGWIRLLRAPLIRPADLTLWGGIASSPYAIMIYLSVISITVAGHALLFVALVGWMLREPDRPVMADFRRNWRAYYWPVLAVNAIGFAIVNAMLTALTWAWPRIPKMPGVEVVAHTATALPAVALMLAPFAVMGLAVGWRRAIVDGLRLLRRRWLALVTLFALFRLGYEVLAVWTSLAPWPLPRSHLNLSISAPAMWLWVREIALALLGLWLAYAFMEIAKSLRRPGATEG